MPHPPEQVLDEFCEVCMELRMDYDFDRSIFEEDPGGRELCTKMAPFFFYDLSRALVDRLLLNFCRITDPAGSGSRTNLTTNYILECLPWPKAVCGRLNLLNNAMLEFRRKIEVARSKRIAHIDLHAQTQRLTLGKFTKGEELDFLRNLQEFVNVAYGHLHDGASRPIAVGASTDTYKVFRAFQKAALYDSCERCSESDRNLDFLNLRKA